jgi:hypothetical protein
MPFSADELTDVQVGFSFEYKTRTKTDTVTLRYRPDRITRRFINQLGELQKVIVENEDEDANKRQLDRVVCHVVAWWDVAGTNLDEPETLFGLSFDFLNEVLNQVMQHRRDERLGEARRENEKQTTSPGISRQTARKTSSKAASSRRSTRA